MSERTNGMLEQFSDALLSRSCVSQRLRPNYVDWDNEAAPTLLMVHGGQDHARNWDWLARALRSDRHVVARTSAATATATGLLTAPMTSPTRSAIWRSSYNSAPVLSPSPHTRSAGAYPCALQVSTRRGYDGPSSLRGWSKTIGAFLRKAAHLWPNAGLTRSNEGEVFPRRCRSATRPSKRRRHGCARRTAISQPRRRAISRSMACRRMRTGASAGNSTAIHGPSIRSTISMRERHAPWHAISCPILILHGENSWLPDPRTDGSLEHFWALAVVRTRRPWVHHDQFDAALTAFRDFL